MNPKLWEAIRYFAAKEFASPDEPNSGKRMNIEFVKMLDNIRNDIGVALSVTSGFRTEEHNAWVGGVPGSAHTKGLACDVYCDNSVMRYEIVKAAIKNGIARIGIGKNFIHLDMDYSLPQQVMWLYTKTGGENEKKNDPQEQVGAETSGRERQVGEIQERIYVENFLEKRPEETV